MSDARPHADAEVRCRIREDFATTLFVEAAAGTGKTTALVGRIVALIRRGEARLDCIVAVTFTEKAAGEMKLRLRGEIEQARASAETSDAERARLEAALAQLEVAHIGTIHGFCAELLRERPIEAGIDPLFEVVAEDESRAMLEEAFDQWFQQALADPPEGLRRVLRRRARGRDAYGPRDELKSAAEKLIEHRDFPAAWRAAPFERPAHLDAMLERVTALGEVAATSSWPEDYLTQNLAELARFASEIRHVEAVRGRDHDGLEAALRELSRARSWRWKGSPRTRYGERTRDEVLGMRDALKFDLDELIRRCDADLAPHLQQALRPIVATYEQLKQRAGRLDFLDLLIRARDLIRDRDDVRAALQQRFTHYFVDELQDTDPLQVEILLLLAADDPAERDWQRARPVAGRLFLVGDPKQSIYRFRRADVAIYERLKRALVERGAALLQLRTSFRAPPALQAFVNAAFAPVMRGGVDAAQADYVGLEPWREDNAAQPAVVALPVPRPYAPDSGQIYDYVIEKDLPDAVGAFVDWLLSKSGWKVQEGGAAVPVQARHVCILFRRFRSFNDDVTRGYVQALEARRIAHVLVGGRSFHDREEVQALRNALVAIEWPDDELRVFATLRGPLFALGDDALLAFRHVQKSLHPLRLVAAAGLDAAAREVAEALAVLRELHYRRNRRPIAETVARLLDAVRAHAGIAIWPTGEQSLANVLRVIDLARRFERRGAASFRAFVERMEEDAERGEAEDAPVVEEGTEGVRIMTVHRAKGLEFPVVVLADPTCKIAREVPMRHVDPERGLWAEPLCGCAPIELLEAAEEEVRRDRAEGVRIAYVAATRARDLLVVPAVADAEREGWLESLNPALYPPDDLRRKSQPAPGCPAFGEDTTLDRPDRANMTLPPIRPAAHRARTGTHTVVWWDPTRLALGVEERVGLRQSRILEADEGGAAAARSEEEHARWQATRRATLDAGARPTVAVETVTALALAASQPVVEVDTATTVTVTAEPRPAIDADVAIETVATQAGAASSHDSRAARPSGKRFGALVHAILATVPLDADNEAVHAAARAHGRFVGATMEEIAAAADAVRATLAHPLLRRAAACASRDDLRREVPVLLRVEGGGLAEGVLDLAFRERTEDGATWTVVDFKTDREVESNRARYAAQVALYARAVQVATGEGARGVLLVV
jgi:ATP-dependent exoDNAse (exonuclease V) beta subunit